MKKSVIVRLVIRALIAAPLLQAPLAAQQRAAADAPAPGAPRYSVIEMSTLSRDPSYGTMFDINPAFDPNGPPSRLVAVGGSMSTFALSGGTLISESHAVCYGSSGNLTDLHLALGLTKPSNVHGLNANGTMIGTYGLTTFRIQQGKQSALPGLGGLKTHAAALNAHDIIVGFDGDGAGHTWAVYWTADDQAHGLELGATDSQLADINDKNVVAGSLQYAPDQPTRVFSLKLDGVSLPAVQALPFGPDDGCWAEAINDRGQIVGVCPQNGTNQPVLWSGGQAIPLPVLPNEGTGGGSAYDINNHGVIVGSSNWGSAVIWIDGAIFDLNKLTPDHAGFLKNARAINDYGVIACESEAGVNRGVLLVPLP